MNLRIGYGHDLHRLQPGGKLVLGGVLVSEDISPIAHSDGDVVLHALVDALLGTIGAGDIGDAFPNSDERWRNADSAVFLAHAHQAVRDAGYQIANVDILILAERPKIGSKKKQIAAHVSHLLGGPPVNIKAGTNEGCDAIGRGEAIAATAIVLVQK